MVEDDIQRLCISPRVLLIQRAMNELGLSGKLLGVVLAQRMRALARAERRPERFSDEALFAILQAHSQERLAKEGIAWLMELILVQSTKDEITEADVNAVFDELDIQRLTDQELQCKVAWAIEAVDPTQFPTVTKLQRFLMGELMKDLIGRVDGRRMLDCLTKTMRTDEPNLAEQRTGT